MSRAAFSTRAFAVYIFIVAAVLVLAPNALLSLCRLAPTGEVWIRLVGLLAFNIGLFAWGAARHDDRHFFVTSVRTRVLVFVVLAIFVVIQLASPVLMLFGVAELLGGLWTHLALKADAASAQAAAAGPR